MPITAPFEAVCDSCGERVGVRLEMLGSGGWVAREMPRGWRITVRSDPHHNDVVATCSPDCEKAMEAIDRLDAREAKSEIIGGGS